MTQSCRRERRRSHQPSTLLGFEASTCCIGDSVRFGISKRTASAACSEKACNVFFVDTEQQPPQLHAHHAEMVGPHLLLLTTQGVLRMYTFHSLEEQVPIFLGIIPRILLSEMVEVMYVVQRESCWGSDGRAWGGGGGGASGNRGLDDPDPHLQQAPPPSLAWPSPKCCGQGHHQPRPSPLAHWERSGWFLLLLCGWHTVAGPIGPRAATSRPPSIGNLQ